MKTLSNAHNSGKIYNELRIFEEKIPDLQMLAFNETKSIFLPEKIDRKISHSSNISNHGLKNKLYVNTKSEL